MNSATKVGEIFTAAGQAFSRLGDLTMQLHPNAESPSGKWTDEEIDMLHSSIMRFSDDLSKISLSIKSRTVSQIRQALKKKAFEDAGIPAKQLPVQQVQHVIQTVQPNIQQQQQVFKSHIIQQQQPQQQQPQAKQIILQPQTTTTTTTTTTVTIKQFQQMQQQKAVALAAAQAAAAAAAVSNTPTITENIIIQQPTSTTAQQQQQIVAATSATQQQQQLPQILVPATVAVVVGGEDVVSTTSTAQLKCGPDVSMTLNRINVQENEVDVEECLPAEVVKLDFVSEEVAG
ncbi:polyglutamine-repeat protein pqn-41 isoform X2 [Drosophila grimshawi]|uniref:GH13390 n=2 Tax=Drosophila grimshawi TaxID=7222 RepID=B4JPJ3_DROGR|nr:polyglutamine-repeat protein pqn-41 isoform X2 [Drosophila grimshawi]EDV98823.1 GH13390 [Drosophila grimshawi]